MISQLEYRINFLTDAILQPLLSTLIELALWSAVFASISTATFGGFGHSHYIAYVLWASFFARVNSNWMYEERMMEEINTGEVNAVLARPLSFFEYYLSQFLGYKLFTAAISFSIPLVANIWLKTPTHYERLPAALVMVVFYVIFLHMMSFATATLAFHFNRVHSVTAAKNLLLWLLSGELIPLDLAPEPLRSFIIALPFSCSVFVPVGYLTERIDLADFSAGFVRLVMGILVLIPICWWSWRVGIRRYTGTGA